MAPSTKSRQRALELLHELQPETLISSDASPVNSNTQSPLGSPRTTRPGTSIAAVADNNTVAGGGIGGDMRAPPTFMQRLAARAKVGPMVPTFLKKKDVSNAMQSPAITAAYAKALASMQRRERLSGMKRLAFQLVQHPLFSGFVMTTILFNAVLVSIIVPKENTFMQRAIQVVEAVFLGIYTAEFLLKIYCDPIDYVTSNYNRFDFVVLCLSYMETAITAINHGQDGGEFSFLRIFRAFRALRALRLISFFRTLQVLVTALFKTLVSDVIDLLLLLLLIMYIFAIMGFYFFGDVLPTDWGTIPLGLQTLFQHVTADSWTDYSNRFFAIGLPEGSLFEVCYMLFGHFIFTNLFVAIIIQNIEDATVADQQTQLRAREAHIRNKKITFLDRHADDSAMKPFSKARLELLLDQVITTARHDDILPIENLVCSVTWLETFVTTLHHQENNMYRCQQIHFEIANVLMRLQAKQDARDAFDTVTQ